jgi:hypothetical protein
MEPPPELPPRDIPPPEPPPEERLNPPPGLMAEPDEREGAEGAEPDREKPGPREGALRPLPRE